MFVLVLIGWPILEVFAFIEVGLAIGWLLALLLLLATSVLGVALLRIQGRSAVYRVTLAVSEHRAPGRVAIEGLLGFLGAGLLFVPGFLTDVLGAVLLFRPTRTLTGRWISHHYGGRVVRFVATTGRFASGGRGARPADVDGTVVEDDPDLLGR